MKQTEYERRSEDIALWRRLVEKFTSPDGLRMCGMISGQQTLAPDPPFVPRLQQLIEEAQTRLSRYEMEEWQ